MTAQLTLISHHLCPYVQRAAIALREKDVPFERVDIDLAKKPDWFLKISPLGKVPLLRIPRDGGEAILFESTVICEYLEETQAGPKLHPPIRWRGRAIAAGWSSAPQSSPTSGFMRPRGTAARLKKSAECSR